MGYAIASSRRRASLRTALSALLCAGLLASCGAPEPGGTRIVLISLDTLRYDSFEAPDGSTTMPALHRWAQEATVFDRFFSSTASTQPSHASMFTGLHPWQHGVSRNGLRLAESHHTLAERLQEAGFATAAVVASFPVSHRFGFEQGFDHFDDEFQLGRAGEAWAEYARQVAGGEEEPATGEEPAEVDPDGFYSLAETITERAFGVLDEMPAGDQFLWVHYFDPHSPYGDSRRGPRVNPRGILDMAARGEDTTEAVAEARELYDVDVLFLDQWLGRLLDRLEEESGHFETHVLLVADHGESFGEDNSLAHGRRLTPGQIHVPLIIRSPQLATGQRNEVCGSADVMATTLALAGLGEAPSESRDLISPQQRAARAFGMRRTYQEPFEDRRLDGKIYLIDDLLFYMVDRDGTIYRGNGDSLRPPSAGEPSAELAEQLGRLFTTFELELQGAGAEELDDPETRRALRALGYV